jgi:precorrin-3B C17-methyltransferase
LKHRKPETPVAIVKGAFRESQAVVITNLEDMLNHTDMLGMITTVIVGNSSTYGYEGMMINPRGYRSKYELIPTASTTNS